MTLFLVRHDSYIESEKLLAGCKIRYNFKAFKLELFDQYNIELTPTMFRAKSKRQAEHLAGRICAIHALLLVFPSFNGKITTASDGTPLWPDGFVGSITHTDTYAEAIVASTRHTWSVGVDAEPVVDSNTEGEIRSEILSVLDLKSESFPNFTKELYLTLAFSAKEAAFKALYMIAHVHFNFHDIAIFAINEFSNTIELRLLISLSKDLPKGTNLTVYYTVSQNYVRTLVLLPLQPFYNE